MTMGFTSKSLDWYTEVWRTVGAQAKRLMGIFVANPKIVAGSVIGVAAVAALFLGYAEWSSQREGKAAGLLLKAVTVLPATTKTPEELTKQEEGLRLLEDIVKRYPRTAAAAEATLRLGGHFYALGKYDEVRAIYQRYLDKNPTGRVAFAAGMGIGDSYLAQGSHEKAAETYLRLIEQFPRENLLPEAYMNLARTYRGMKREQDAARLYEKVVEGFPNTGWAQNAQSQLRTLVQR